MDLYKDGISILSEEGKAVFMDMFPSEKRFLAFKTAMEQAGTFDLPPNLVKNEGGGAYSFFPEGHKSNPRICAYRGENGNFIFTKYSPKHNSGYNRAIQETRKIAAEVKAMAKQAKAQSKLGPAVKGVVDSGLAKISAKAAKSGAKSVGKSLAKKIPLLGVLFGGFFAATRAMAGDFTGAGMELASGVASIVPGAGTTASVAIDAALMVRDMKNQR